ncbi:MAG: Gfo/Idh/MocA family oxidoreductase [Kiritimatiellae bacterium]|nr:Gfo/Idh/MocA family oxidoreductase [Kiritimatiellia bacterium]
MQAAERQDSAPPRPVRYGLIGCGDMGQVHAMNYVQQSGLVETVAVCDINEANIRALLKHLPDPAAVRVVTDYRALLDMDEIEAVVVSTPNDRHLEIVRDAFAAGKHVLCEKPLEVSLARSRQLVDAWRASGRILQIGLVYRYSPLFRTMAEMIRAGKIGVPLMAWCHEFRQPFPVGRTREWRYDAARSGGALVEKDCHHFDLFNWMLGAKPVRVQAMGGQLAVKGAGLGLVETGVIREPYPADLVARSGIYDHAWVNVEYENGTKANLGLCFFAPDFGLPFGVLGSEGRLTTRLVDGRLEWMRYDYARGAHETAVIDRQSAIHGFGQIGHSGGFDQHVEFCRCVREERPAFCDGQVGIESLYPAFAGQLSIAEGGRVVTIAELTETT